MEDGGCQCLATEKKVQLEYRRLTIYWVSSGAVLYEVLPKLSEKSWCIRRGIFLTFDWLPASENMKTMQRNISSIKCFLLDTMGPALTTKLPVWLLSFSRLFLTWALLEETFKTLQIWRQNSFLEPYVVLGLICSGKRFFSYFQTWGWVRRYLSPTNLYLNGGWINVGTWWKLACFGHFMQFSSLEAQQLSST